MASSGTTISDANRPSTPGATGPSQSPVELPIRTPPGPSWRSVVAIMTPSPTAAPDLVLTTAPHSLPVAAAVSSSSRLPPTIPVPIASFLNSSPRTGESVLANEHTERRPPGDRGSDRYPQRAVFEGTIGTAHAYGINMVSRAESRDCIHEKPKKKVQKNIIRNEKKALAAVESENDSDNLGSD